MLDDDIDDYLMPLTIVRNDITKMAVDAIVNAANTALQMGDGVCGAIFNAAGADKLQAACSKLAPIQTGEAVITPGFRLPAKYIIHTAGPVYRDGKHGEETLLSSCYTASLNLAMKNGCESIAFPLISSGIYGYPKEKALSVATNAIGKWLLTHEMDVSLVVFDKEAVTISRKLHDEVEAFIGKKRISFRHDVSRPSLFGFMIKAAFVGLSLPRVLLTLPSTLGNRLGSLDEPFSTTLLRIIDAKGISDAEVYKRANIDRRLFSKIRADKDYRPKKETVIALAVALELTLNETEDLLERAGLALSRSMTFDVIVAYFISKGKYDIHEINKVLYAYDQSLLGGKARD